MDRPYWADRLAVLALEASQHGDPLIEQALLFLANTLDCDDWRRGTLAHLFHDLNELVTDMMYRPRPQ